MNPRILVGVGGWTYEPWRTNFYPPGLPHPQELAYASRRLSMIEINGTYYSAQKPSTFAKWRDETPDDFLFSVKASRYATNRRVLAEAGESIERFVESGITELKHKLGPIVWQFAPTKKFDASDFEGFLKLLPREVLGRPLRHALDVRHESFRCVQYLELAWRHGAAHVFTESDDYPAFADLTADFVYARLMRTQASLPEGIAPQVLADVAACARQWHEGREPAGLPRVAAAPAPAAAPTAAVPARRDVFLLFISAAKEMNPAAAMALRALLAAE